MKLSVYSENDEKDSEKQLLLSPMVTSFSQHFEVGNLINLTETKNTILQLATDQFS